MHESGFAEDLSPTEEDTVISVSVEPVECPIESDGTLRLSTLQTQMPGAAGLWYEQIGAQIRKRGLKFDGSTERFLPPHDGWGSRPYFVSYSYTSPYRYHEQYKSATDSFQSSITAVQKLFELDSSSSLAQLGHTDISQLLKSKPEAIEGAEATENGEAGSENQLLIMFQDKLQTKDATIVALEAKLLKTQDELAKRVSELERLRIEKQHVEPLGDEIATITDMLQKSKEENAKVEGHLEEMKSELQKAQQRVADLEQSGTDSQQVAELTQLKNDAQWRVGELEAQLGEKDSELNALRDQKAESDRQLAEAQQSYNDLKWKVGEMEAAVGEKDSLLKDTEQTLAAVEQTFNDTKWRCGELEGQLGEKSAELDGLRKQMDERVAQLEQEKQQAQEVIQIEHVATQQSAPPAQDDSELQALRDKQGELERQLTELQQEHNGAKWRLGELEAAVNDKDGELNGLRGAKDELERNLADTQQALNDAKWRCGELEAEVGDKSNQLDGLRKEVDERIAQFENEITSARVQLQEAAEEPIVITCPEQHTYMPAVCPMPEQREVIVVQEVAPVQTVCPMPEQEELIVVQETAPEQTVCPMPQQEELIVAKETATLESAPPLNELHKLRESQIDLERQLCEAERVTNDTKWRVGELEAEVAQKDSELNGLRDRQTQLDSQLAEAHQTCSDAKWRLGELEAAVGEKDGELNSLRASKDELEQILGEARQACDDAKWRCGELEAEVGQKSEQLNNLRTEMDELEAEKQHAVEGAAAPAQNAAYLDSLRDLAAKHSFDEDQNQLKQRAETLQAMIDNEKDPEISRLNEQVAELQAQVAQVTKNFNDTKWRCGELEAQIGQTNEQLDSLKQQAEQRVQHLEAEREQIIAERPEAHEQDGRLQEANQRADALQSCIDNEKDPELNHMRQRIGQLEAELAQTTQNYNDAKWRCGELETECSEKNQTIDGLKEELQNRVTELESKNVELNERIQSVQQRLSSSVEEAMEEICVRQVETVQQSAPPSGDASNLQERINQLQNELAEATKNYNDAKWRVGELEAAIGESESAQNELWMKIQVLEGELEDMKQQGPAPAQHDNDEEVEKLEKELHVLKHVVDKTRKSVTDLEAACGHKDEEIGHLKDRIGQLEGELGQMTQNFNDTKWRCGELESETAQKNSEKDQLEAQLQEAVASRDGLANELSQAKSQLGGTTQEQVEETPESFASVCRHSLEEEMHDAQKHADDYKTHIEELEATVGQKDCEMGGLRDRVAQVESELAEMTQNFNDTKWRCGELEAEAAQKNDEKNHLEGELHDTTKNRDLLAEKLRLAEAQLETQEKVEESPDSFATICRHGLEEEMHDAQKQADDAAWRIGELEAACGHKDGEIGHLKDRLAHVEAELAETTQNLNDTKWRCGELEAETAQKNDEKAHLETLLCEAGENKELLAEKLRLAEAQIEVQEKAEENPDNFATICRHGLEEELNEAKKGSDDLKWRVGELDALVGQKDHELGELRGKVDNLEKEHAHAVEIYHEAKYRVGELESACQQKDDEMGGVRSELESKAAELDAAKTQLVEKIEQPVEVVCVQEVQQVQQTPPASMLTDQVAHLQEDNLHKDQEWAALLHAAEQQIHNKDAQLEKLRKTVKDLSTTHSQTSAEDTQRANEFENELVALKDAYDSLEKNTTERIQYLEQELEKIHQLYNDIKWRCGELESGVPQGDRVGDLQRELTEVNRAMNDARWRVGELETILGQKDGELSHIRDQMNAANGRIKELEEQQQQAVHPSLEQRRSSVHSDEGKKYEMECHMNQLTHDLNNTRQHCQHLESELKRHQEELWIACERKAELEHQAHCLDSERNALHGRLNDCQGRIEWLESELEKIHEHAGRLDRRKRDLERHISDSFLIRKEPYVDRQKWMLTMLDEYMDSRTEHHGSPVVDGFVRTWFEIDAPNATYVNLTGSFVNWEASLMCTMHPHGKWGVWVDLPKGRYEFRFVVDGDWWTSNEYGKGWNDYGTENNYRFVE